MSFVDYLKAGDVVSPELFARYAQEQTGVPYPKLQNMSKLKGAVRDFFIKYPNADYHTLTKLVKWSKDNNVRFAQSYTMITKGVELALKDGQLQELLARPKSIDVLIDEALSIEEDPVERYDLMTPTTTDLKIRAYNRWIEKRDKI